MNLIKKTNNLLGRLAKDNKGSMAMTWGVSMTAIILSVGSAYDFSQLSKAQSMAQLAADNMALAASISIDFANEDRYVEFREYSYSELGGPSEDFTGSMVGVVEYDVLDEHDPQLDIDGEPILDENGDPTYKKLIARSEVSGAYRPAFMSIIGYDSIPFSAGSDVAYADTEGTPASIFFVADNSGSMGWLDDDGIVKINSLEDAMESFMSKLAVLDTDGTDDTFRTALYPYTQDFPTDDYPASPGIKVDGITYKNNCPGGCRQSVADDGIVPSHVIAPEWGIISDSDISRMYDRQGTDSSGALQKAADKFSLEDQIHLDMNPEFFTANQLEEPLKFMVFMSDGANNHSYECHVEEVWVENETAEYWWKINRRNRVVTRYREPRKSWRWNYVPSESDGTGYYEEQESCDVENHFNIRSLEACDQMKEAGVLVYAIAYDVQDDWRTSRDEIEEAETFMQSCSSGDNFFKSAGDASALQQAFEEIGDAVVTDVIRVKR